MLSHVLESAGIATVALVSNREVAERMHPPRALYGEFPLGRPLGKPGDPAFQRDVLLRGFALIDASEVPVLVDHPEVIELESDAVACAMPARFDPSLPPSVDEARALRAAYDRAVAARGATSVGMATDADGVPEVLAALSRIVEGANWAEAGLPGDPVSAAHDVRNYYEEAAVELADDLTQGSIEVWFSERTEAGQLLLEARRVMKDQGAPFPFWFYMAAGTRG